MSYHERAAPSRERQEPASNSCKIHVIPCQSRIHRRGRRSILSKLRRSVPKRCRALPGTASGESEASVSENNFSSSQPIIHFAELQLSNSSVIHSIPAPKKNRNQWTKWRREVSASALAPVSYTQLRAHETLRYIVLRGVV